MSNEAKVYAINVLAEFVNTIAQGAVDDPDYGELVSMNLVRDEMIRTTMTISKSEED